MSTRFPFVIGGLAAGAALLAGCGSSSTAATTGSGAGGASSSSSGTRGNRGIAAGEIAQLTGDTLILNTANGDVTVTLAGTTTYARQSTGRLSDITAGLCVTAAGQKGDAGSVQAAFVSLRPKDAGASTCRRVRPTPAPGSTPRAGASSGTDTGNGAQPSGFPGGASPPANLAAANGEVGSVSGNSVVVHTLQGADVTVTVGTSTRITKQGDAARQDLVVGDCAAAQGPRDSAGAVTARSVTLFPASSGGCTLQGGLGGGFGGRGFGGGGGGGAGAGAGAGAPPVGGGAPPND